MLKIWHRAYEIVPEQLKRAAKVERVATAFNTNIDAVVKISGKRLSELAAEVGMKSADLQNPQTKLHTPQDAVRGISKCFINGIAEEWLCDDKEVYTWLEEHLGCKRLQMGGQAGIIANVSAILGVQQVYAHTAAHPKLMAEQFVDADNLCAFAADGTKQKAREVNRDGEEPPIHLIMEFDAGDTLSLDNQIYICPKSNRFIATYDTVNTALKINDGFVKYIDSLGFDFMILSGFHALTAEHGGLQRIAETLPLIKKWKQANPNGIIHLELASTQDLAVRRAILEQLAPVVDSLGLNEREALEAEEIVAPKRDARNNLNAVALLNILLELKQKLQTPRIQLHFYGMYMTLQNKDFPITPEQNKRGMMLAATVAASKAATGNIEIKSNLLQAHGRQIGEKSLQNLCELAAALNNSAVSESGITECGGFDLIAVPTILAEKPLTLVGMGDTISAVSLIGAR